MNRFPIIAVVIPCYRVKRHILDLLDRIGDEVDQIFVIDDACPEDTGAHVREHCSDPRVHVAWNKKNLGVGGAVMHGYQQALDSGATIIVKMDGDGQMDPGFVPALVKPIVEGEADYSKGNRFFSPDHFVHMPWVRLIGNSGLSFINKLVSGYWNTMDPTNGYTAIHARVARLLPFGAIDNGYFFESDILFRLGTFRAVVREVPMQAVYADEHSSLSVTRTLFQFPLKFLRRLVLRIGYNYFLRDFNVCSLEMMFGGALILFGGWFGWTVWAESAAQQIATPTGTVMLSVLPIILGFQLLLSAISFDIGSVPKDPIHPQIWQAVLPSRSVSGTSVGESPAKSVRHEEDIPANAAWRGDSAKRDRASASRESIPSGRH